MDDETSSGTGNGAILQDVDQFLSLSNDAIRMAISGYLAAANPGDQPTSGASKLYIPPLYERELFTLILHALAGGAATGLLSNSGHVWSQWSMAV